MCWHKATYHARYLYRLLRRRRLTMYSFKYAHLAQTLIRQIETKAEEEDEDEEREKKNKKHTEQ